MLPPFIIEQIRRREDEERRRRYEQPVLELPLESPYAPLPKEKPAEEPSERGVIIIDSQVDETVV
jgi:hypothetical protein